MFTAIKKLIRRLFGKEPEPQARPAQRKGGKHLSHEDRRQIEAAIAKAKGTDKKELSAQDSIPYQRMFPDGICRVTDTFYTKTVQFQNINYQLSQNEDKTAIFEGWSDFLNYFDSSIRFQLSFLNLSTAQDGYARSIVIPLRADKFNDVRDEYSEMLQNQLAKGNNGLTKTKYLTFGIDADSIKAAKPRLERIEMDVINNFKRLGMACSPMNGMERLHLLHGIFHMDGQDPFRFSWDWLAPSGLSTKDFIAPSSFEFKNGRMFRMGQMFGAVSFLQILAPELNDRMLADFLDMESSQIVSLHIQSVDQISAIKTVKRKITDLDRAKIEEQKKAVRAGYDMDIIPSDLATYGTEAKKLLQDLQSRNERMFLVTFLVVNTADSQRQLDNNVFQASSIAQKYNCQLTRLDFQQEEGLMSSLPLGRNQIEIQRGLTTSSTAIFVPFTTQELFQSGGEALYYGLNALSNNLIMVDRKAQLSFIPPEIPSQREQMEAIQEAESADAPSAFSIPQAEVDRALRGYGGKLKIFDLYHQNLPARSIVAALRKEYGTSGGSYILSDGSHIFLDYRPNTGMEFWNDPADKKFIVKWAAVEKRIRQLIQEGSYLSAAEMEQYLSGHQEAAPEQEAEATGPVTTDMDVDKLLVEDWGITGRKQRIFALYQQGLSDEQIAEHLRTEYNKHGYTSEERAHEGPCVLADGGEGYGYFVAAEWRLRRRDADGPMRYIGYEEMAHHIRGLIDAGRYLTPEELAQYQSNHLEQPPAFEITQADIDTMLRFETPLSLQNLRIYEIYQQNLSVEDTIDAIRKAFGRVFLGHTFPDGTQGWADYYPDAGITMRKTGADKEIAEVTISWSDAEKRLRQLIEEGRYLTPEELEQYRQKPPEQMQMETAAAEGPVHVPGATPPVPATVPPREITQADIDLALQEWNGDIASKRHVQQYMTSHARDRDTAE